MFAYLNPRARTADFPKARRFTLTERLVNHSLDALDCALDADLLSAITKIDAIGRMTGRPSMLHQHLPATPPMASFP
ncbi:MAG: hypothetical protein ACKVY0_16355 [Prosthecobacter sp.]|uniref:hypothetical protein n=1 Tax=Prosthecobacter sp. TaxID=1965333 RepID=UPI003901287C